MSRCEGAGRLLRAGAHGDAGPHRITFGSEFLVANRAVGDAVEVAHHFNDGALHASADRELNRLERAFTGGDVHQGIVEEGEHAGAEFAADDLLLVGDDVDHFERAGIDDAEVERDVHHVEASADVAAIAARCGVADEGVHARRADVVVEFGDAADEVIVRAGHLASEDAANVVVACAFLADQAVVGVAQLEFGDRSVEALDQARAGFGESRDRHQRGALGDAAAAVFVDGAGVVEDAANSDARSDDALRAAVVGQAIERWCVRGRIGGDGRVANRQCVHAVIARCRRDAGGERGGRRGDGESFQAAHHLSPSMTAVMSPLLIWFEVDDHRVPVALGDHVELVADRLGRAEP